MNHDSHHLSGAPAFWGSPVEHKAMGVPCLPSDLVRWLFVCLRVGQRQGVRQVHESGRLAKPDFGLVAQLAHLPSTHQSLGPRLCGPRPVVPSPWDAQSVVGSVAQAPEPVLRGPSWWVRPGGHVLLGPSSWARPPGSVLMGTSWSGLPHASVLARPSSLACPTAPILALYFN